MPANLPPQYYALERDFRAERDVREKIRIAEEMLRIMPKHKGTDHLQADMKTKISKLKKQLVEGPKGGSRQAPQKDHIEKEGAGQVILIGPPNAGKSSLLDALTNAKPLIGDYPFTTRDPQAGMTNFETVQFQLIDTPPIAEESWENYMSGLIRNADLVVLVADLEAPSMLDDLSYILNLLEDKRIALVPQIQEVPDDPRFCYKKTVICAHKVHDDESGAQRGKLSQAWPGFTTVATSIIDEPTLDHFRETIFKALSIIRVYTKPVGKDVDYADPIVLAPDSTVEDAAYALHKDFAERLKYAKIWGEGKHDGQRVNGDFQLIDGDIIEFHT